MPLQIEIANSLLRCDIFQLDAHKGQAPHLKARAEGDSSVAVVTTWILAAWTVKYQCIINSVLGAQEVVLWVQSKAVGSFVRAKGQQKLVTVSLKLSA